MTGDLVYVKHILDAMDAIEEYISPLGREQFLGNRMALDATVRELEVIGEATKKLSESLRVKYPHVPWKAMAGMRDKLIHDYMGVDREEVWHTATVDIPHLGEVLQKVLGEFEG